MKYLLITVTVAAAIATVLSLAGSVWDCGNIPEICASLRLVLILALALTACLVALLKARKTIICLSILVLLCVAPLWQFFPTRRAVESRDENRIRVLEINLWGGRNKERESIIDEVKLEQADFVCMSEITQSLLTFLEARLPEYPYVLAEPQNGGVALFSRLPFNESSIKYLPESKRSRIIACVSKNNVSMRIFSVHTQIPIRVEPMRDRELEVIASEIQGSKEPVILVGDLNLTPFSYHFDRLLYEAKLEDPEKNFGITPTWNAFWPIAVLPIDHCLTSSGFTATARRLGRRIGSDHIPLVVDLSYTKKLVETK